MKSFNTLLSVALVAGLLFTASCKKDKDPAPSKTALLTAKTWNLSKAEVKIGSSPAADFTSEYQDDCEKDDLAKFNADKTFNITVGEDDCDGSAENENGTWSFKNNETVLEIVEGGDTQEFKLVSIDGTYLKFSFDETFDLNGDGENESTGTVTFIFIAK